jgi:hypothetical protein
MMAESRITERFLGFRPHPHGDGAAPPAPSATVGDGGPPGGGRGPHGRFAPGNKFSRGNPFYRRQAALRQALLEAVTADDLQRLARQLLEQALAGDVAAARTLLLYVVGKPTAAVNPDEADLDEFRLVRERPSISEVVLALIDSALPGKVAEALALPEGDRETPLAYLERLVKARGSLCDAATVGAEREAKRRRRKS